MGLRRGVCHHATNGITQRVVRHDIARSYAGEPWGRAVRRARAVSRRLRGDEQVEDGLRQHERKAVPSIGAAPDAAAVAVIEVRPRADENRARQDRDGRDVIVGGKPGEARPRGAAVDRLHHAAPVATVDRIPIGAHLGACRPAAAGEHTPRRRGKRGDGRAPSAGPSRESNLAVRWICCRCAKRRR